MGKNDVENTSGLGNERIKVVGRSGRMDARGQEEEV